jgi:hypothetical protein
MAQKPIAPSKEEKGSALEKGQTAQRVIIRGIEGRDIIRDDTESNGLLERLDRLLPAIKTD